MGTPRPAQYGQARTRAIPSLPQVLAENGLPETAPLATGERGIAGKKEVGDFYNELQVPSRIELDTGALNLKRDRTAQWKKS